MFACGCRPVATARASRLSRAHSATSVNTIVTASNRGTTTARGQGVDLTGGGPNP